MPGVIAANIVVDLAVLLTYSSVIALIAMAVAFATYMVLKNLNVENPTVFAAVAGISMPISAIALLFLRYLQFMASLSEYFAQVP